MPQTVQKIETILALNNNFVSITFKPKNPINFVSKKISPSYGTNQIDPTPEDINPQQIHNFIHKFFQTVQHSKPQTRTCKSKLESKHLTIIKSKSKILNNEDPTS